MRQPSAAVGSGRSAGGDWAEAAVSAASGREGIGLVAALAEPVVGYARSMTAGSGHPSGGVLSAARESLLPVWDLGWAAYHAELGLASCFAEASPSEVLLAAGDDALSIVVCAQLWFDHATFARSYLSLRPGLEALDSALPSGCSASDFPLFRAVDVLACVHEACRGSGDGADRADAAERALLPAPSRFETADRHAVSLDGEQQAGERRAWGVKTASYLVRSAELLPLPGSLRARHVDGVEECFETVLGLTLRSLERDGRSRNGDSDMRFRAARCRWALGDVRGAMSEMDLAVDLYDGSSAYISEQYHQLRLRLESEEALSARVSTAIREFEDALDARLGSAQDQVRRSAAEAERQTRSQIADSTFRVVEILGVFLALIGFMATAVGTAVLAEGSILQRAGMLAGGWLGCVAFFWLLRRIVRPDRPG